MNLHPYRSFTLHLGFQIGVEDLVKWHELRREICSVGIVRCLVGLNEQGRVAAGLDPVDMIVTTEPPRVYRRVSSSIVMPLFQRCSSLRRMPPLLRVA